ncbi:MAG: hypothetical protein NZ961_14985, partial [Candidatus Poribacteria bacterium]|nr:hypothetical protein [Candidatus Poribacteria bacterium]
GSASPFINFSDDSTPTPLSRTTNMTENSTDKQPQNKDSLTKEYKTEIGKTHERYDEIKPAQFKLRGSYTPRKTKDRNSDGIVTTSPQKL